MQRNDSTHTGISRQREKEEKLWEGGGGASVVEVVVAVHHQCLEEEHGVNERQRGVNSWHAAAASQCQRKETCLPTSKIRAKERHRQRRAKGLWDPGVVNRANPQGHPANYKVRQKSGDQLLLFLHSSTNYLPSITTFSFWVCPACPCSSSTLDDSSAVLVIIHVFFRKQLLAQLRHHLDSACWTGVVQWQTRRPIPGQMHCDWRDEWKPLGLMKQIQNSLSYWQLP